MNLHKHQLYLLEQHSESFKSWSAIIRINTEGKSLIMKLGRVIVIVEFWSFLTKTQTCSILWIYKCDFIVQSLSESKNYLLVHLHSEIYAYLRDYFFFLDHQGLWRERGCCMSHGGRFSTLPSVHEYVIVGISRAHPEK